jgi:hypothetical protein
MGACNTKSILNRTFLIVIIAQLPTSLSVQCASANIAECNEEKAAVRAVGNLFPNSQQP